MRPRSGTTRKRCTERWIPSRGNSKTARNLVYKRNLDSWQHTFNNIVLIFIAQYSRYQEPGNTGTQCEPSTRSVKPRIYPTYVPVLALHFRGTVIVSPFFVFSFFLFCFLIFLPFIFRFSVLRYMWVARLSMLCLVVSSTMA